MPAEEVGRDAAGMLVDNLSHGGCVDEFLQDQVIYVSYWPIFKVEFAV